MIFQNLPWLTFAALDVVKVTWHIITCVQKDYFSKLDLVYYKRLFSNEESIFFQNFPFFVLQYKCLKFYVLFEFFFKTVN